MTDNKAQHPWAKYYSERGISRPPVAALARRPVNAAQPKDGRKDAPGAKQPAMSADLAAAVAAVNALNAGTTAAPFITTMQREAAAKELKRRSRLRLAKHAALATVAMVMVHFAVTRLLYRAPTEEALQTHVQTLPETVVPLFSSVRQPLQTDGVVITQADRIDAQHFRYVATVTLRLRKPLYAPAVSNGTASYRRLQEALQRARDQELRYQLFEGAEDAPQAPALPPLLQRVHQAGETIVVRVPFIAKRFGWTWRIQAPQLALAVANRRFDGDSIERYAGSPYLIFGTTETLGEIRRRTKLANNYVMAVAKEVQRHADVEAVDVSARPALADLPAQPSLADLPAQPSLADVPAQSVADAPAQLVLPNLTAALADLPAQPANDDVANKVATTNAKPAFDPNAPAVFLPAPSSKPAVRKSR